jgi:hypothetical protein
MLEAPPVRVNVSPRNPNPVAATIAGRNIYSTGPAAGKRSCSWSPSIETGATTQKTPASIVSSSRRTELDTQRAVSWTASVAARGVAGNASVTASVPRPPFLSFRPTGSRLPAVVNAPRIRATSMGSFSTSTAGTFIGYVSTNLLVRVPVDLIPKDSNRIVIRRGHVVRVFDRFIVYGTCWILCGRSSDKNYPFVMAPESWPRHFLGERIYGLTLSQDVTHLNEICNTLFRNADQNGVQFENEASQVTCWQMVLRAHTTNVKPTINAIKVDQETYQKLESLGQDEIIAIIGAVDPSKQYHSSSEVLNTLGMVSEWIKKVDIALFHLIEADLAFNHTPPTETRHEQSAMERRVQILHTEKKKIHWIDSSGQSRSRSIRLCLLKPEGAVQYLCRESDWVPRLILPFNIPKRQLFDQHNNLDQYHNLKETKKPEKKVVRQQSKHRIMQGIAGKVAEQHEAEEMGRSTAPEAEFVNWAEKEAAIIAVAFRDVQKKWAELGAEDFEGATGQVESSREETLRRRMRFLLWRVAEAVSKLRASSLVIPASLSAIGESMHLWLLQQGLEIGPITENLATPI